MNIKDKLDEIDKDIKTAFLYYTDPKNSKSEQKIYWDAIDGYLDERLTLMKIERVCGSGYDINNLN